MPDVGKWMHLPLAERIYEPSWWLSGVIGFAGLWAGWFFVRAAYRMTIRALGQQDTGGADHE